MVPAFPLDGGRITRAARLAAHGDRHKATRFPAYLGQGFAVLMTATASCCSREGDHVGGLWWIVLGWMLGGAARAAVAQSRFADRLDGVTAGDIMDSEPVTIPACLPRAIAPSRTSSCATRAGRGSRSSTRTAASPVAHRAAVEHAALLGGPTPPSARSCRPRQLRTDTPLETLIGSEPLRTPGRADGRRRRGRLRGGHRRAGLARASTPRAPSGGSRPAKAIVRACPHTTS